MSESFYNKTFQKIMICGRLAKDPSIKFVSTGKAVANFGLVVNDESGGSDYIPCVAWEKKAKLISDNLSKGDLILCEGRLKSSSIKDSEQRKQFFLQFELSSNGKLLFLEKRVTNTEELKDGAAANE